MSTTDQVLDPFDVQPTRRVSLGPAERVGLTEQVAKWRSMMTTPVAATPALQAGTPPSVR